MKRKLVQINTVCNTSTGKIMGDIQRYAEKRGYSTISFVGRRRIFKDLPCEKFGNPISFWIHVAINTVFDRQGYGSYFVTRKLVKRLREENPDIIHLHNLHGYYLNIPVLFDYLINEFEGKVFWTFHDCWPFTGHCAHFTAAGCEKWRKGCNRCQSKTQYPISFFMDSSARNYNDKKKLFCQLKKLTIITPSEWMKTKIEKSFFCGRDIKVVNNGIDLERFSYRINEKTLEKYGIRKGKKIILGVSSIWNQQKGLTDFIELSGKISSEYQLVLVGLSKRQINKLPSNIIGIKKTENLEELVTFYSVASIFLNPSLEESFSLVTVEAMACGTPVVVLDSSAVKELVCEENGIVLSKHAAEDYMEAIERLEKLRLRREVVRDTVKKYGVEVAVKKIIQLYESK